MQKIKPFLWFDTEAEEAANFYVPIFKNSKILGITRCGEAVPGAKGSALTVSFQLDGQEFVGLNGGPHFEAISFAVICKTQEEVDDFWRKLTDGGQEVQFGWLRDTWRALTVQSSVTRGGFGGAASGYNTNTVTTAGRDCGCK